MIDHALLQIADAARSSRGAHLAGDAQAVIMERAAAITAATQQVGDAPHRSPAARAAARRRSQPAAARNRHQHTPRSPGDSGYAEGRGATWSPGAEAAAVQAYVDPGGRASPGARRRTPGEPYRARCVAHGPDDLVIRAEVEEMFALTDALDPPPTPKTLPKPPNPPT